MIDSFQWDEHFVTGLEDVDHQHHNLVDLINKLGHLLADNELVFEDVESLLIQLLDYAELHFWEEELLMQEVGVDLRHVTLQKKQHKEFIDEIKRLQKELAQDKPEKGQYLLDFLTHWLACHILGIDKAMSRQVAAIESGLSPAQAYEQEERDVDSATAPLLKALHALFEQVSIRNKELSELNEQLEQKVEQRTQALLDANLHLEQMALTDVLTNLPNRRHAMGALVELWREAVEHKQPLSLMMIDADHFKEVNDTFGHDAGDEVLCEVSKTLTYSVRNDDMVCRLGGDEFLIICPNTPLDGAMHIANIVREKVAQINLEFDNAGSWQGSVSIGVAEMQPKMAHYEELIKAADRGVYGAKSAGKNCVFSIQN